MQPPSLVLSCPLLIPQSGPVPVMFCSISLVLFSNSPLPQSGPVLCSPPVRSFSVPYCSPSRVLFRPVPIMSRAISLFLFSYCPVLCRPPSCPVFSCSFRLVLFCSVPLFWSCSLIIMFPRLVLFCAAPHF
jgi:hypothetical protein